MKFREMLIKGRFESTIVATAIAMSMVTPMSAIAYSSKDARSLDNQAKTTTTLTFNEEDKVEITLDSNRTYPLSLYDEFRSRTMLSVRGITQLLNEEVNFEPEDQEGLIQITKESQDVLLKLGRNGIMTYSQPSPIYTINENIGASTFNDEKYLPLRTVANALGVEVNYSNGKVDILTEKTITEPIEGLDSERKLVPRTNPELTGPFQDKNSPKLEGNRWVVPEGLIYTNPTDLKPGDVLTIDQIKTLMPEIYSNYEETGTLNVLNKRNITYIPEGARVDISKGDGNWTYTRFEHIEDIGYRFVDGNHNLKGPKGPSFAWDGTAVIEESYNIRTQLGFSAGKIYKLQRADELANLKYVIYMTTRDPMNNSGFVTFYNTP